MQNRLRSLQEPILGNVNLYGVKRYLEDGVNEYVLYNSDYIHFHNFIEIGLCVSGEGICYIDGKEYAYRVGSAQFVLPTISHYTLSIGDTLSHWKWIFIDPMEFNACLWRSNHIDYLEEICGGIGTIGVFDDARHPEIARNIQELMRELDSPMSETKEDMAYHILCALVIRLVRLSKDLPKYRIELRHLDNQLSDILHTLDGSVRQGVPAARIRYRKTGWIQRFLFSRVLSKSRWCFP